MINDVGKIVSSYGKGCILVTRPAGNFPGPLFDRIKASLKEAGVDYAHFDGVIPNPTTDCITEGANIAKNLSVK
jgi:alcohol dehydrogenase class IV